MLSDTNMFTTSFLYQKIEQHALLLIVALGSILRIYHLGHQPLWIDEIFTWQMCNPSSAHSFFEQLSDSYQSPLYFLFSWLMSNGSRSEVLLRIPAAIAGIVSIPVIALLAKRIFNQKAGLMAAFIVAISPYSIWYSQEGRGYTFLILFASLSTLLFLNAIKRKSLFGFVLYGIVSALMMMSNQSGLFLIFAHIAVFVTDRKMRFREYIHFGSGLLLALLIVSPWLLKAFGILEVGRMNIGADTGDVLRNDGKFMLLGIPYSFYSLIYGFSIGPSVVELHRPDKLNVVLQYLWVLAPTSVLAGVALLKGFFASNKKRVFLLLIFVPIAVLAFLSLRNIKTFNPRYLTVIYPFLVVLISVGLLSMKKWFRIITTFIFTSALIFSLIGYYFNPYYTKSVMKSVSEFVSEKGDTDDLVIVPLRAELFKYYYLNNRDCVKYKLKGWVDRSKSEAEDILAGMTASNNVFWFVEQNSLPNDHHHYLIKSAREMGDVIIEEQFRDITVLKIKISKEKEYNLD